MKAMIAYTLEVMIEHFPSLKCQICKKDTIIILSKSSSFNYTYWLAKVIRQTEASLLTHSLQASTTTMNCILGHHESNW